MYVCGVCVCVCVCVCARAKGVEMRTPIQQFNGILPGHGAGSVFLSKTKKKQVNENTQINQFYNRGGGPI